MLIAFIAACYPIPRKSQTVDAVVGAVLVEPDVVSGAGVRHDGHAYTLTIQLDCGHPQVLHYEEPSHRHPRIIADVMLAKGRLDSFVGKLG
jgi:hypothetical protein